MFERLLKRIKQDRPYLGLLYALAETSSKPVEILRVGTFYDMYEREVTITSDDLDAFVENFMAGAAGQDVPIDIEHNYSEAAGWVKELWREGDRLVARIEWNDLGRKLVGDKVYRYVSAALDISRRVLRAVSLVNFPAVKGLAPLELQDGVYTLVGVNELLAMIQELIVQEGKMTRFPRKTGGDDSQDSQIQELAENGKILSIDKELTMSDDKATATEELRAKIREEVLNEAREREQTRAELRAEVRAEVEVELQKRADRRQALTEFANDVCGGDFGLAVRADDLVAFLEKLNDPMLEEAKALFRAKVVDFRELGSSREGKPKKKLPDAALADVRKGELTVKQLIQAKVLPGTMDDYDLSEFSAEQIG